MTDTMEMLSFCQATGETKSNIINLIRNGFLNPEKQGSLNAYQFTKADVNTVKIIRILKVLNYGRDKMRIILSQYEDFGFLPPSIVEDYNKQHLEMCQLFKGL